MPGARVRHGNIFVRCDFVPRRASGSGAKVKAHGSEVKGREEVGQRGEVTSASKAATKRGKSWCCENGSACPENKAGWPGTDRNCSTAREIATASPFRTALKPGEDRALKISVIWLAGGPM